MKLKLLLIEFICMFLVFCVPVKATEGGYIGDTTGYSNGGVGGSGYGSCSTKDCLVGFEGIRMSLIKTSGEVISYKNYFFMSGSNPNTQSYRNSWNNGRCNKISYLKGLPGCNDLTPSTSGQFSSTTLPNALVSTLGWGNPSGGNNVRNWDVPGLVSKFSKVEGESDPAYDAKIEDVYVEVFDGKISNDPKKANYKRPDELNDYWIVIEPLFYVKSKSGGSLADYYGTQYELATLNYKSGIADLIERVLPCATMVTGSIAQNGTGVPGIGTNSYFDGTLNFVSLSATVTEGGKTIGQFCTSAGKGDKFTKEYLTGHYGTGIGLIWVGSLTTQMFDCKDVEENYKGASLSGMSLDALNKLPEQLSYTINSNKVDFSRDWYIKQCTCYGVMDYYQKSQGVNLGNLNLPQINAIFTQNTGIFSDYAKSIQTEGEASKVQYGRTTPITYADYVNRKCPFTAGCTNVKFNDLVSNVKTNVRCDTLYPYYYYYYYYYWDWYWYLYGYSSQYNEWRECVSAPEANTFYLSNYLNNYINSHNIGSNCSYSGYYWYYYYDCWYNARNAANSEQTALLRKYGYTGDGVYKYNFSKLIETNTAYDKCKNLYLYGDEGYTTKYIQDNQALYESCFKYYNQQKGTNWSLQSYKDQGCSPEFSPNEIEIKVDCTPKYNVGTCLNGDIVYYIDEALDLSKDEYWDNCIFNENGTYKIDVHKSSKPDTGGSLSYFDSTIGSQYCEVYCTEEMYANFDKSVNGVYAGRYFAWNDHNVKGSRTCRTKSVEWTKYESDIKTANTNIENSYVSWQLEIKKKANIDGHHTEYDSSSCRCIYSTSHNDCCMSEHSVYHSRTCSSTSCSGSGKSKTYTTSHYDCSYYTYPCDAPNNLKYDLYKADPTDFTLYTNHGGVSQSWGGTQWCSNEPTPATDVYGLKSKYEGNIAYAGGLTKDMKNCYTWEASNVYNIYPTAEVHYSDGYYSYDGNMDTSVNYSMSVKNDCKDLTSLNYTDCSGTSCYKKDTMKQCTYNDQVRNGTAYLTFRTGIYQYISKYNNTAYCANVDGCNKNIDSSIVDATKYINIGNTMFPVAYSTSNGIHSTQNSNGQLLLTYDHLGHIKNGSTDLDNILSSFDVDYGGNYRNWNCQFRVVSKLITPDTPEGINLLYRPIDLNEPFPDINGNGRDTGFNWCDGNDCKETNENVRDYITNNRGVKTDDIYYTTPMYTFVLTPSIISQIRSYNSSNSYTSYTGSFEGKSYDYKCNNNTGKNCISDYLTYLIEITNAKNNPGTCVKDENRTYNDVTNFENCR